MGFACYPPGPPDRGRMKMCSQCGRLFQWFELSQLGVCGVCYVCTFKNRPRSENIAGSDSKAE